ncbi:VOC family protein [Roseomonas terrae]|jgi:catechol 2,3-dioxygenase-like lactoylglutathione lyase family enzyme|uniref:VOC family protein n=1 Tax=Neoroseomonas terrae TaxID=424799 RepID=A0ABS5EDF9_9PROT|nr:VOC family protein [Neoroseomonas terrae]MBR0649053.1 VOC family protein [Neoroseomonas terrae]
MLDHIGIDVSDIDGSKRFYAAVLGPLGYVMTKDMGEAAGFGVPDGEKKSSDPAGEFWIAKGNPQPPLVHVAFSAMTRGAVDDFHKAALAAGGRDNGGPGLREKYHPDYYAAFILDPDGYNIEAVCHLPG